MTTTRLAHAALCGVLFCAACAEDEGTSVNHYAAELAGSLDAVAMAADEHHQQALRLTEPAAADDLERAHVAAVGARMSGMEDAQRSIGRCADEHDAMARAGGWQSMHDTNTSMHAAMGGMAAEMQRHARAVEAAEELEPLFEEENAHRARMQELIDAMRTYQGDMLDVMAAMQEQGLPMMCSARSHMHH